MKDVYSLTYPNFEVSSSIKFNYLTSFFDKIDPEDCNSDSLELVKAFLARDAETVGTIFTKYCDAISYHQRLTQEKQFHSNVQSLLMGMDFKLGTEMPGAVGRLDLCVELPKDVYVIIELKYCPSADKLSGAESNRVLANLAIDALTIEEQDQSLAELAKDKLSMAEIRKVTEKYPPGPIRDKHLAAAAMNLPKEATDKALASAVEKKLPPEEIDAALEEAAPAANLTKEQIEIKLSEAAQTALKAITEKNYHGIVAYKAKEIIDLGLSAFGHEPKVKALFAPKPPSS
jgi:hypothetical protein